MSKRSYTGSLGSRAKRRVQMPIVPIVSARVAGGHYRGELKFKDTGIAPSLVTAAGLTFFNFDEIAQGTGESQRIGRKVTLRYFELRGHLELPPATVLVEGADQVRFILYCDKQTNGANAAPTDLLQTADIDSLRNMDNISRFTFIKDETFQLNATVSGAGGSTFSWSTKWIWDVKLDIPLIADGADGDVTELRSNHLAMLAISRFAFTIIRFNTRVRYSDD